MFQVLSARFWAIIYKIIIDPTLMMAQSRAESTWEINNYGRFINQFPPNIIKSTLQYERINKKKYVDKNCPLYSMKYVSMEKCSQYIYIYIYIYIYREREREGEPKFAHSQTQIYIHTGYLKISVESNTLSRSYNSKVEKGKNRNFENLCRNFVYAWMYVHVCQYKYKHLKNLQL